jgi:four helix bundle protein
MDAAMLIHELTKRFPKEETFSMTNQFRKSSRSVAANIAEAWRKRRYPAAFVSKLSDAEAEAAETQTWTELALRCGYVSPETAADLDRRYEEILGQLVSMIGKPQDWVIRESRSGACDESPPPQVSASPHPRVSASPCPRVRSSGRP